jgi:FtsZ-binding cell division protein ZapB
MSKQDDQAKSSIRANVKSRREQFEEQLRSLQEDIASLSLKMEEPSRNGMR